jgi:hypothetical protein
MFARKLVSYLCLATAITLFTGCTPQSRGRSFGGTAEIQITPGFKLVNVTWKGDDLWILTRHREEGENPTTYVFAESSSWGALNGKIKIIEQGKQALPPEAAAQQPSENGNFLPLPSMNGDSSTKNFYTLPNH